ncbi:unnamed protein product [Prunus brigantina]
MFPTKSSGVDGMSALFYQKYWGVVGNDVVGYYLNVLNGSASVKEINQTLLTLIPKVDNPVNSVFVPTRLITNNIIATFESIHAIKGRGGSKLKKMVLKLDMSKAYNILNTWDTKLLSAAGKEVLIKAVGQTLPTYTMGVFQLPKSLCQELSAMIARYWWGKSGRKGIHWLGWRKLCKPKCLGGLGIGFINFEAFKKAMVAKQAWQILEDPGSLVGRLLKARNFPNGDFMPATAGPSPFMIWKAIL